MLVAIDDYTNKKWSFYLDDDNPMTQSMEDQLGMFEAMAQDELDDDDDEFYDDDDFDDNINNDCDDDNSNDSSQFFDVESENDEVVET